MKVVIRKNWLVKALCTSLLLSSTSGCSVGSPSAAAKENRSGLDEILHVAAPSVAGPQRRIADYKGDIVMLHFFSSWCAQCGAEAPTLRNLQSSFKDSRFTVLGVAIDDDPFQMQTFVSRHSINFPVLLDITGDFKTFFGIKELPATLFLDRQGMPIRFKDPESGQVTARIDGPRAWDTIKPVEMIAGLVESF